MKTKDQIVGIKDRAIYVLNELSIIHDDMLDAVLQDNTIPANIAYHIGRLKGALIKLEELTNDMPYDQQTLESARKQA